MDPDENGPNSVHVVTSQKVTLFVDINFALTQAKLYIVGNDNVELIFGNKLKCLQLKYINITVTIVDNIHRPVLYLKHTVRNVRTSPETHYVSATSPTS
jgi:hypothetical protein